MCVYVGRVVREWGREWWPPRASFFFVCFDFTFYGSGKHFTFVIIWMWAKLRVDPAGYTLSRKNYCFATAFRCPFSYIVSGLKITNV